MVADRHGANCDDYVEELREKGTSLRAVLNPDPLTLKGERNEPESCPCLAVAHPEQSREGKTDFSFAITVKEYAVMNHDP
jgi:hypothetical protein